MVHFQNETLYSNENEQATVMYKPTLNLTNNVEQKKSNKGIHTIWFHSYEVQAQKKLIYGVRGHNYSCSGKENDLKGT